jgi:hypothetical protein
MQSSKSDRVKVHTIYRNAKGERIPSVTTIIDILDKPALMHWAWKCGIEGLDYRKVRDEAGTIGTITHHLAECFLKKKEPILNEYQPDLLQRARGAFNGFTDWFNSNSFEMVFSEKHLISEKMQVGGTIDFYGSLHNGTVMALVDLKTSNGLWPEHRLQVAAYRELLLENGYKVDRVILLHIDKETGDFAPHNLADLSRELKLFKLLLKVYPLMKSIWRL